MSRRGHNEGSIFRRNDGRWASTIDLGWQAGKRRRKTYYGRTRVEVQAKLIDALRSLRDNVLILDDRQTTSNYLAIWLETSVRPSVRPRTFKSYEEIVNLHLSPLLGHIPLAKLVPQDVQNIINHKLNSGLSNRRVQYIHAVLRRALVQAERWDLVSRNVAKLVTPPRVSTPEVDPFSPEEARKFLEVIKGDRLEALFCVSLATGIRQGEVLGLSRRNLDLEAGVLHVRSTLQKIDGKYLLLEPKTARSRRSVALPEPAWQTLETHLVRQAEEKLIAGTEWENSGLVFTTELGGPLSDGHVRRRFYRILKDAGLRRQRFHDLRHACASLLLAQNVHPRVVMETLGHSTIATTMNAYSHVMPSLQREAAGKMTELLAG